MWCCGFLSRVDLLVLLLAVPQLRDRRLNEPLPSLPDEDVAGFAYSPDGERLAYWVNQAGTSLALFIRASDGSGAPLHLADNAGPNPQLVSAPRFVLGGTHVLLADTSPGERLHVVPSDGSSGAIDRIGYLVDSYQIDPGETRIVYRADPFTDDRYLLFSVPIAGSSTPIVLNGGLIPGGDVHDYAITPDGAGVVYAADQSSGLGIYVVPIDGSSAAIRIDDGLSAAPVNASFRVSADNARVVFFGVHHSAFELFSVPIDASSTPVHLNQIFTLANADVYPDFQVSPDGDWVAFRADATVDERLDLFGVPIDASALPVQLNPAAGAASDVASGFQITPGARVLFRADPVTASVFELFSAPIDGSAAAVQLDGAHLSGEDVSPPFAVTPDGSVVAFLVGWTSMNTQRLYRAPVDGSAAAVLLDDRLDPDDGLAATAITPDGERIVYRRHVGDGHFLRSVRLDGGFAPLTLAKGDALGQHTLGPDGVRVAYSIDEELDGVAELFTRPVDGGGPAIQVSPQFAADVLGGQVFSFRAGDERVVYVADQDPSGVIGLFSVPLHRPGRHLRISDTSTLPIDVVPGTRLEFVAGGERVLFEGWIAEREWLFSSTVESVSDPIVLNLAPQPYSNVSSYEVIADGELAVYLGDQDTDETFELYGSTTTVQGERIKLSGTLVENGDVQAGFEISPDGSRVAYVADQDVDERFELYSTTGAGAAVKLSTPGAPRDVQPDLLFSPDGSRVFYREDPGGIHDRMDLYSAPSDGSSAPAYLSPGSVEPRYVFSGYRVTPDGTYALFVADLEVDTENHLYRSASDGSTTSVLLSTHSPTWDVSDFLIDPSGTRAVYHVSSSNGQIYSVPIAGGVPPTALTHTHSSGSIPELDYIGGVDGYQITSDGSTVLYLHVSTTPNGPIALWAVAIDRSSEPYRVSPNVPGINVHAFRLDPLGQSVSYLSSNFVEYVLYHVPLDLSRPPLRIDRPASARIDYDFRFTPDGSALLFRDQYQAGGIYELFASYLGQRPRSAPAAAPSTTVTR